MTSNNAIQRTYRDRASPDRSAADGDRWQALTILARHLFGKGPTWFTCYMSPPAVCKRSFMPKPSEAFAFLSYSTKRTQPSELVALAPDTERCGLGL
jgi:hypothetical protein